MLINHARQYIRQGWPVFPLLPASKKPATEHGFHDATLDAATVENWFDGTDYNIAIATGAASGLVVIDLDIDPEGHNGRETWRALQQVHGEIDTRRATTGGGGEHCLFNHPGQHIRSRTNVAPGIDVRADGGYIVAPPSVHPNGRIYQWVNDGAPLADLPTWLLAMLTDRRPPASIAPASTPPRGPSGSGDTVQGASELLDKLSPARADDYGQWIAVGMSLSQLGAPGLQLWDEWSKRSPKYSAGVCERKWLTFKRSDGVTLGSLYAWAEQDAPRPITLAAQRLQHSRLTRGRLSARISSRIK